MHSVTSFWRQRSPLQWLGFVFRLGTENLRIPSPSISFRKPSSATADPKLTPLSAKSKSHPEQGASSTSATTIFPWGLSNHHSRRAHLGLISKEDFRAPKDPVVLCHGLFGFDVLGPGAFPALQIHYWRNVKDALRDLGCNIAVARVGTVAALKTRAFELRTFLERNMEGQRVNLVAHSMGGLDCRYLISHLPYSGFSINSVTTVATPHRGSSFMDWCRDAMGLGVLQDYVSKQVDDVVAKHLSVAHPTSPLLSSSERETIRRAHPLVRAICAPIDSPGFANLTREYCAAFNELTPDDPRIYYSSYAAVSDVSVLSPLHFSWRVVRQKEGENDGLVSLDSARWGEFLGTLDADHWQLIPPRSPIKAALSRVSGGTSFDSVGFYLRLVTKLADRGF